MNQQKMRQKDMDLNEKVIQCQWLIQICLLGRYGLLVSEKLSERQAASL